MTKMTREQWQAYRQTTITRCQNIAEAKNKDYTAGSGDVFANFRMAESVGIPAEMGIILRMMDKMQRVRSFVQNGTLAVKEESAQDAVDDLINYSLLLGGMLKERTSIATETVPGAGIWKGSTTTAIPPVGDAGGRGRMWDGVFLDETGGYPPETNR